MIRCPHSTTQEGEMTQPWRMCLLLLTNMCRKDAHLRVRSRHFLSKLKPLHKAVSRSLKVSLPICMKPHPLDDKIFLAAKWISLVQSTYSTAEQRHSLLIEFHSFFPSIPLQAITFPLSEIAANVPNFSCLYCPTKTCMSIYCDPFHFCSAQHVRCRRR